MGQFNKVSGVLGNAFDRTLRSGYVARSVAGAGVGGAVGAGMDSDNRTAGFLTGASIGSGLGAGSRRLQALHPGLRGGATRRMYARSAMETDKFIGPREMQGPMPFSGPMAASSGASNAAANSGTFYSRMSDAAKYRAGSSFNAVVGNKAKRRLEAMQINKMNTFN